MRSGILLFTGLFLVAVFIAHSFAEESFRLATTTSLYETGLLDYILPPFEEKYNLRVHVISVGTGKAIKLGENGDVDILLVHARDAEEKFLSEGFGVNRREVMYNDFIILGPGDDPAGIAGVKDAKVAVRRIYASKQIFVSRGDESGTHKKEKYLWAKAGLEPGGSWYLEAGQGMSVTLLMADEKNAYVLVDRATYLFHKDNLRIKKLVEGDRDLLNPYGVIAVSPYRHPHVKYELSMALIGWLTSPECQRMINEYKKKGEQLFHASAAEPIGK